MAPVALMAAAVGGQIFEGIAAEKEGKAEWEINRYNAALKQTEAKEIEAATGIKQMQQSEEAARQMSGLEATAGGAGSSPLVLVFAKQAAESELENLMIGREGTIQAAQARSEAENYRMAGKFARIKAKNKAISSYISAGSTMLSGFGGGGGGGGGGTSSPGPGTVGTQGPTGMGW